MSTKTGFFGQRFFGTGFFGAVTAFTQMPVFLAPAGWETIFSQSTETEMVLALKVYKNGSTISLSDTDRFSILAAEHRIGITAEMGASLASGYVIGDQVQTTLQITPGSGTPFELSLFNGFVSTIATGLASTDNEEPVIVYLTTSQNQMLDEVPSVTSWVGTASSLLEHALLQVGCASTNIDIDDYPINATLNFQSWRDLLKTVASGLTNANVCITASGVGFARAWNRTDLMFESDPTGFLIPRSGWTGQSKQDSVADQYRKVTVQGYGGVIGTAVDQNGTGIDYSETSQLLTTTTQCSIKAQSILDLSKRSVRVIETPINPLVRIGALVRTETAEGTVSGKILAFSHGGEWPGGFWSRITVGVDA